jgi:ATP-dependent Lon protease
LEIPEEIRNKLKFVCVEHLDEVLQIALAPVAKSSKVSHAPRKKKSRGEAAA